MKPRDGGRCAVVMGLDVSGYGIVRSLAREDVPIVGLWRGDDECGRFSRYCATLQVAPDQDDRWISVLLALATRFDRPVLFPSNDRYAELLARYRATLEPVTRFHWVDESLIETVLDKARIGAVCERAGVAVPRTCQPRGPDLAAQAADFTFPCLVKPRTRFRAGLPGAAKVIVCQNAAELAAVYRQAPALLGTTIWQEVIEGGDDAIWQGTVFASRPGQVDAVACMRKIRQYPPGFGITSFGCTEWQAAVVEQTARLVGALGWTGIASVEFKHSVAGECFYYIEMNPRVPWYNVLFRDAGINLSYLSWCDLTGVPAPAPRQTNGVGWISLASDCTSFWRRWRAGTLGASQWLGSLVEAQSFAWYEKADPEPAITAAVRFSGMGWRKVAGGQE